MRPGHIPRVEACDPSPAGGGEVDEDCTMASPVHVCRAVCMGVCLFTVGGLFITCQLPPVSESRAFFRFWYFCRLHGAPTHAWRSAYKLGRHFRENSITFPSSLHHA